MRGLKHQLRQNPYPGGIVVTRGAPTMRGLKPIGHYGHQSHQDGLLEVPRR